ncbi:MAG: hypothetical protein ABSA46_17770 [Thermodesulfovibrionales bacterium]|jgi:hypothetical protein
MKVTDDTRGTSLFNFPVQATGADIFKKAIENIHAALERIDAVVFRIELA